jgi:hypothetical protein
MKQIHLYKSVKVVSIFTISVFLVSACGKKTEGGTSAVTPVGYCTQESIQAYNNVILNRDSYVISSDRSHKESLKNSCMHWQALIGQQSCSGLSLMTNEKRQYSYSGTTQRICDQVLVPMPTGVGGGRNPEFQNVSCTRSVTFARNAMIDAFNFARMNPFNGGARRDLTFRCYDYKSEIGNAICEDASPRTGQSVLRSYAQDKVIYCNFPGRRGQLR